MNAQADDKGLVEAACDGDAKGIRKAIADGADIKKYAYTAVIAAIDTLLESDNPSGLLALHENGVNINATSDKNGRTGFHHFMEEWGLYRNEDSGKAAFDAFGKIGVDWNAADVNGDTPLHLAKSDLELSELKSIKAQGGNLNAVNNAGEAIAHAVAGDTYGAYNLKDFVGLGMDLNVRDKNGNTPFHQYAKTACNGDDDPYAALKVFRDAGVDLHAKNNDGKTASDLKKSDDQLAAEIEKVQPSKASFKGGLGGTLQIVEHTLPPKKVLDLPPR